MVFAKKMPSTMSLHVYHIFQKWLQWTSNSMTWHIQYRSLEVINYFLKLLCSLFDKSTIYLSQVAAMSLCRHFDVSLLSGFMLMWFELINDVYCFTSLFQFVHFYIFAIISWHFRACINIKIISEFFNAWFIVLW